MKKLLILTAVGAMLAVPAMAVQKCVALDGYNTMCDVDELEYGNSEFKASCGTYGTGVTIPVRGIGICSNTSGSVHGSTSDTLVTVSSVSDSQNVNCWCKIISPIMSPWVSSYSYSSASECAYKCAYGCAFGLGYVVDDEEDLVRFFTAIFSNLSD
ncbi:MAG: hypothetical protein J6L70_02845 [Alphaproteobacteria bacterium]|nr:hypothetical protein [Alphaproteobacteria bacterium]